MPRAVSRRQLMRTCARCATHLLRLGEGSCCSFRPPIALQYRHYKACLDIFRLQPTKESHEFSSLVGFVAQVSQQVVHDSPAAGRAHSSSVRITHIQFSARRAL